MKLIIDNQALACKYLTILLQDFDMLEDGTWVPDKHSIDASRDVVNALLDYVLSMTNS